MNFRVHWSAEDREFVATTADFPSLSWLDVTPAGARSGLIRILDDIASDI